MGAGEIATVAVLTVSVILALIFGIGSLRQTGNIQKKQYRHTLLKEIIDWATDIAILGIFQGTPEILRGEWTFESWSFIVGQDEKLEGNFQPLRVKSVYVSNITKRLFPELGGIVDGLIKDLGNQIGCLYEYRKRPLVPANSEVKEARLEIAKRATKLANNNKQLYESAVTVLEETARVQSKDIAFRLREVREMTEVDVAKEIVEIKKMLVRSEKKSDAKFNISIGLLALVLALTFIPPVPNLVSGIILAVGGFLALFVGLKQSRKDKKSKSGS